MIERGEKKLREAEFFYRAIREEGNRAFRREHEAIDFYLSAFLNAARNVTFALKKEHKERYEVWFADWYKNALTKLDRDRMDFLRDQRNSDQKEGTTALRSTTEQIPIWQLQRELESGGGSYEILQSIPGTPAAPRTVDRRVLSFDEPLAKNVVDVCGEHLAVLRRLVVEFQRFIAS